MTVVRTVPTILDKALARCRAPFSGAGSRSCARLFVWQLRFILISVVIWAFVAQSASGYSVLTHQTLVDLAWNDSIQPLLLDRYPGTTESAVRVAHAYAYGGCAIQDVGYYPFGKELFSDLTHYVRTGDFIVSLFRNAQNVNEYAFAIGALSHYLGDSIGHSAAVNRATAVAFPDLEQKFGPVVTYDESPHGHVRTEFAFDIDQLVKERIAPSAYLRFIGLRVPLRLLERAFYQTYGLRLRTVVGLERPAIRGYRSSVRSFIPRFADAEAVIHRNHFPPDLSNEQFRIFESRLSKVEYERRWMGTRKKPGFVTHILAIAIRILPKIGPISYLSIKIPTPETQDWYVTSVNRTIETYRRTLDKLREDPTATLALANLDLDTGIAVQPGSYRRTDKTYATLVDKITSTPDARVPGGLWRDLMTYYTDLNAPLTTKKDEKAWKRLLAQLEMLKHMNRGGGSPTSAPAR